MMETDEQVREKRNQNTLKVIETLEEHENLRLHDKSFLCLLENDIRSGYDVKDSDLRILSKMGLILNIRQAVSKIEWTEKTWNPVTGCTPVSPGCKNCYAKRMAKRLAGRFGYPKDNPFKVTLHPEQLDKIRQWRKPINVFLCSMGDLFHNDVPDDFIYNVYDQMGMCKRHNFLVLTKRPKRMVKIAKWWGKVNPNIWHGVSVEDQQRAEERIPELWKIQGKKFISFEPLLEHIFIPLSWMRGIDWVIVGAENAPKKHRRPMNDHWIRRIRNQCQYHNIPLFYKQQFINDKKVSMPELDGRVWDQYPEELKH